MVKPNRKFNLDIQDISLIEDSLRYLHGLNPEKAKEIQQLLGKIHNQKNWYRPKDNYVSG